MNSSDQFWRIWETFNRLTKYNNLEINFTKIYMN